MFSIAARYTEETMPIPQDGKMWEAGHDYLERARQVLGKREDSVFNPYLFLDSEFIPYVATFYGTGSPPSGVPRIWNRVDGTRMAFYWYLFIFRTLVNNSLCFVGTGIRMVWCQSIFRISAPHDIAGFRFGLEL